MKNTRVAFLNTSKAWGGGEKWHFNTAQALQDTCAQVFFIGHPDGVPAQRLQQTKVQFFPLVVKNLSFLSPIKSSQFSRWLRDNQIDTLVVNSPAEARFAAPAAKRAGVTNVVFRRGMPHPIKNNMVNRWVFGKCVDRVIANSEEIARSLNAAHDNMVPRQNISVVYNGIDLDEFDQVASTALYQADNTKPVLLGTAGRMVKQKNQKALIEAAAKLKQRGCNFRLLFAGTGALEQELKQYALEHDLAEEVIFLGFVSNIKDLLDHIDVFVFSSLYEGSANALIEACAAALPTVAFDVSSNPEIINHEHNGLLADLHQVDEFAACCERLIADADYRTRLGANARQDVVEKFSQQTIWKQICKVLQPAFEPSK